MRAARIEELTASGKESSDDDTDQVEREKLIAHLRGMELKERDEVIDALISQENF